MSVRKIRDRVPVLTDLFMGAVFSTSRASDDAERETVRRTLGELMMAPLPQEVLERIEQFDPSTFDLTTAAKSFQADPPMAKRRLLELLARVVEADSVFDLEESEYLKRLARLLNMKPSEYEDLVFDLEFVDLVERFEMASSTHNPIPEP